LEESTNATPTGLNCLDTVSRSINWTKGAMPSFGKVWQPPQILVTNNKKAMIAAMRMTDIK
jgi:hypothetical protein